MFNGQLLFYVSRPALAVVGIVGGVALGGLVGTIGVHLWGNAQGAALALTVSTLWYLAATQIGVRETFSNFALSTYRNL